MFCHAASVRGKFVSVNPRLCVKIWFSFTVAVLLLSAMDRYHIVSQFKQRERVVIIDPAGTYYLSPLLQFSEARDLHVQQAELATMAFLERNPKDFDNPDLLKLMFLKSALAKAQDERVKEMVEFRAKQLHQKAETFQSRLSQEELILSRRARLACPFHLTAEVSDVSVADQFLPLFIPQPEREGFQTGNHRDGLHFPEHGM